LHFGVRSYIQAPGKLNNESYRDLKQLKPTRTSLAMQPLFYAILNK